MTRRVLLVALLGLVGCSDPAPQFHDKHEEYRYLRSLSNPTVDQFRRLEELKADREVVDHEESLRMYERFAGHR